MDFVHCNRCFRLPNPADDHGYSLSSCGHILCDLCCAQRVNKCPQCNAECQFVPINVNLPDNLKVLFNDIPKEVVLALKIFIFKMNLSQIVINDYIPLLEKKCATYKIYYQKAKAELDKCSSLNQKLAKQVNDLKREFSSIRDSSFSIPSNSSMSQYMNKTPVSNKLLNQTFRRDTPSLSAMQVLLQSNPTPGSSIHRTPGSSVNQERFSMSVKVPEIPKNRSGGSHRHTERKGYFQGFTRGMP